MTLKQILQDFNLQQDTDKDTTHCYIEQFYESAFDACKKIPLRSRLAILIARRVYRQIGRKILQKNNIYNYDKSGKIYVNNLEKLLQTIFSLFDLFFLFFKQEKHSHMKLEHNLINTKIKLNERI